MLLIVGSMLPFAATAQDDEGDRCDPTTGQGCQIYVPQCGVDIECPPVPSCTNAVYVSAGVRPYLLGFKEIIAVAEGATGCSASVALLTNSTTLEGDVNSACQDARSGPASFCRTDVASTTVRHGSGTAVFVATSSGGGGPANHGAPAVFGPHTYYY